MCFKKLFMIEGVSSLGKLSSIVKIIVYCLLVFRLGLNLEDCGLD